MPSSEITLRTHDGELRGLDFGGAGPGVLLVHGSGHNAAAWTDMAALLTAHCHPVALDMRGHGQTSLESTDPEQYWRDIGGAVTALGWQRPILVGHSAGGYAITAATASGTVSPAGLCVVDGVVLDDRATSLAEHADVRSADIVDQLREVFRYGWHADEEARDAYVESCVREAPEDWLNAGARPGLVRDVARRSFLERDGGWLRRPTIETIAMVGSPDPDATVFPSVDVYDRIDCPLVVVLADRGFYAARRAEVRAVVDSAPGRRLVDVPVHHNVPMASPAELAAVVLDLITETARPPAGDAA